MVDKCRELKRYKGFRIFKSWTEINNKQYEIVYDSYDNNDNYFDSCSDLKNLKKLIDKSLK